MKDHLFRILNSDPNKYIASRGFFENYPIDEYLIQNDAALIKGCSDHEWVHIIASDAHELENLLIDKSFEMKYVFSIEDWMLPHIIKNRKLDWLFTTKRFIKESSEKSELSEDVIDVNPEHARWIYENSEYQEFTSVEYIRERIQKGISAGLVTDEKLVAWGFTHDDGSLGFLHVLEAYRRKGYAKQILKSLINKKIRNNKEVFGNVTLDNLSSMNLLRSLGFEYDRNVTWIKLS